MSDTRTAVVEAAAELLRDQGIRGLTTRAVAQAAGVQGPTIYRLFGDKDGLMDAVAEHVMAEYVATKAVAEDGADPVDDLWAGWRTHVEFGLDNPELYALLNTPGRVETSPATAAGVGVLQLRVRRLAEAGLLRVDEARAVAMIHAAGSGTILALLSTPPESRDTGLATAMFDAVAAQILTTTPRSPSVGGGTTASAESLPDPEASTVAVTFATQVAHLPALTEAERTLMTEWLTRSLKALRKN